MNIRKDRKVNEHKLEVLNETTMAAIEEGRRMINDPTAIKYSTMEELKEDIETISINEGLKQIQENKITDGEIVLESMKEKYNL